MSTEDREEPGEFLYWQTDHDNEVIDIFLCVEGEHFLLSSYDEEEWKDVEGKISHLAEKLQIPNLGERIFNEQE